MKQTRPAWLPDQSPEGGEIEPGAVYRAFEPVSDGRKARGKPYPLAFLLTLLVLAKRAGETSISGVGDETRKRAEDLRQPLGWSRSFPTNATCTDALSRANAEPLVQVSGQVIHNASARERCGDEPTRRQSQVEAYPFSQVVMDGTTLRGTWGQEDASQPGVHLLSFSACQSGMILAPRSVGGKEQEISAPGALLHPALVTGRLIRADAMPTQKQWCATVTAFAADEVFVAKDNQPTFRQDLVDFFPDPAAQGEEWTSAKRVQKGHGRREGRQIWTSTQLNEWVETEWAGVAHVFCLHRQGKEQGHRREETVDGLTSGSRKRASGNQLLPSVQDHWRVEKRLPDRREVTLGEDASPVRKQGLLKLLQPSTGLFLP